MTPDAWLGRKLAAQYLRQMQSAPRLDDERFLRRRTLVVAPHQDDETLGCGGTILRKRMAGADVVVLFMGDGSTSHSFLMDAAGLSALRSKEALAACRVLGVEDGCVTFLNLPESQFAAHQTQAIAEVTQILSSFQPEQVFYPYHADPQPDHIATNQIVRAALHAADQSGRPASEAYEYPVWLWFQWPWVPVWQRTRHNTKTVLLNSLRFGFGRRFLSDFGSSVDIEPVLDEKRAALAEHRSQVTELVPGVGWPTLTNFCNGDFTSWFFRSKEWFHKPE